MAGPSTPVRLSSNSDDLQDNFFGGVPGAPNGKLRSRERKQVQNERQARIRSVARRLSFGQRDPTPPTAAQEASTSKEAEDKSGPVKGKGDCLFLQSPIRLPDKKKARPEPSPPMKRCHSSSTSMEDLITKRLKKLATDTGFQECDLPSSNYLRCRSSMGRSLSAFPESRRGRRSEMGNGMGYDKCLLVPSLYDTLRMQSLPLVD